MPHPKNCNNRSDHREPRGSARPFPKRGPKPRPIVEFPEPLTSEWSEPPTFPEAVSLHMSRHGDSCFHLHRSIVRREDRFDRKTLQDWAGGRKSPNSLSSVEMLGRIEHRYRLPEGYFRGRVRNRAMVIQQKTKRPVQFELLEPARSSLSAWLERRGGSVDNYAFPSRVDRMDHLSTRQYARLVEEWISVIGLRKEDYGTHSLRRTKSALIYKQTGNLRAVQILLGHSKIETTVSYLGVEVEGALTLAEATEV